MSTDRLHVDAEDIAIPKFDLVGAHVDDHAKELDELAHQLAHQAAPPPVPPSDAPEAHNENSNASGEHDQDVVNGRTRG